MLHREQIVTSPALRYHGSKFRLAPWVMSFFPRHLCYVEPFGGAAGVLLQKERAYAEVYNDLDSSVSNFFRVIRDPLTRQALIEALAFTPYSRNEFDAAWQSTADPVEDARRLCIRAQMGFGSAGATKGSTGFRVDSKRAYGTAMDLWLEYPDAIRAAGQRFSGVLIENRPAIEVMLQHDGPDTLFFVDPPYVQSTRVIRSNKDGRKGAYRHEMDDADHVQLLNALVKLNGYVVLSGYPHEIYNDILSGWQTETTKARISGGRGGAIRNECVWINPACSLALKRQAVQQVMFGS